MKSKKDILKWWEQELNTPSDLMSFHNGIDRSCTYTEDRKGLFSHIIVNSKRWKYPIHLDFYKQECIRISGF